MKYISFLVLFFVLLGAGYLYMMSKTPTPAVSAQQQTPIQTIETNDNLDGAFSDLEIVQ